MWCCDVFLTALVLFVPILPWSGWTLPNADTKTACKILCQRQTWEYFVNNKGCHYFKICWMRIYPLYTSPLIYPMKFVSAMAWTVFVKSFIAQTSHSEVPQVNQRTLYNPTQIFVFYLRLLQNNLLGIAHAVFVPIGGKPCSLYDLKSLHTQSDCLLP